MKSKKKVLALVACAVLLVVGSVMGTMAWLTDDSNVATNTFSVGNVTITLDETDVDEYGVATGDPRDTANSYKLIPGHTYVKDPIVHVQASSEPCWIFVKITDEIADIQDTVTVKDQMLANNWTLIDESKGIYANKSIIDARTAAQDVSTFSYFKVLSNADVEKYNGKTITVQAYAVQADGFATYTDAWTNAPLSTW